MKLLFCTSCEDIIRLVPRHTRHCRCGSISGEYDQDGIVAHYRGPDAVPLFIANGSLVEAIRDQPEGPGPGREFTAGVIPVRCPTFVQDDT